MAIGREAGSTLAVWPSQKRPACLGASPERYVGSEDILPFLQADQLPSPEFSISSQLHDFFRFPPLDIAVAFGLARNTTLFTTIAFTSCIYYK